MEFLACKKLCNPVAKIQVTEGKKITEKKKKIRGKASFISG